MVNRVTLGIEPKPTFIISESNNITPSSRPGLLFAGRIINNPIIVYFYTVNL